MARCGYVSLVLTASADHHWREDYDLVAVKEWSWSAGTAVKRRRCCGGGEGWKGGRWKLGGMQSGVMGGYPAEWRKRQQGRGAGGGHQGVSGDHGPMQVLDAWCVVCAGLVLSVRLRALGA